MHLPTHAPWWRHQPALARVVRDLVAAELAQARPGRVLPPQPWDDATDLARDLGADSLDLMAAAGALADLLGSAEAGGDQLLGDARLGSWVAAAGASLARHDARLVFRTSGSSGTPKRCAHGLGALWREVAELAQLVPGHRRILAAVPAHHIYGFLFTVLLPQALGGGTAPLPVRDLRGASPAALAALLAPGDLVVAHPDYWENVAALAPEFPADVVGVSSTAAMPDAPARILAERGLRLLQVYGSSETAGVGWRDAPAVPYRLFPYWRRADDGAAIERALGGEIEHHVLQDRLAWCGEDTFIPGARLDAAVQVGGTNVFPCYVAEVLALHPQVAQCAVRPMRLDEGRRLKAFVVARAGTDPAALREALDAWARERLSVPERPAAYSFGPALPRGPTGKAADWIIDAWE